MSVNVSYICDTSSHGGSDRTACSATLRYQGIARCILLLHRRATAAITARITTAAVEEALEDSANVTIAVTMKTKAFHSIVAQRIVEAAD